MKSSSGQDFMYLYWTMSKILLWHLSTSKWTQIIDWVGRWLFKTSWLYRIVTALTFDNWADFTELSQRWLLTSVSKVVTALTFQKSVCHSADFSKVSLSQRWLFKSQFVTALTFQKSVCHSADFSKRLKSQRCDKFDFSKRPTALVKSQRCDKLSKVSAVTIL